LLSSLSDLPRPKKDGEATRVDMVCTYHPNTTGTGLDREQLYLELEQLTHNITQLGPYSLDQNSLYVNGKLWSYELFCNKSQTVSL
jgi:hypothetical protein